MLSALSHTQRAWAGVARCAGEPAQDASQVEATVEAVLHLGEISMSVLGDVERVVGTGQRRLEVAKNGVDRCELRTLDGIRAAARNVRFVKDAGALHGLEAPQAVGDECGGAASDLAAKSSNDSLVNGRCEKQAKTGAPDSVVCTAATNDTLFSDPRPGLPPGSSPPR